MTAPLDESIVSDTETAEETPAPGDPNAEKPVEGADEGDFSPDAEQDGVNIEKGDRSLFEQRLTSIFKFSRTNID